MTTKGCIACPRCGASVELPANYCDMCGEHIAKKAAPIPPRPAPQPADVRRDRAEGPGTPVSERSLPTSKASTEAACRMLASAYQILKDTEKATESIETPPRRGSLATVLFGRLMSRRSTQPEMAELHRVLDLAAKEAGKAAELDPDVTIQTDAGPLDALALQSIENRIRGNIEFLAGKPREAISHYQASTQSLTNRIETQNAYFDLAIAYEYIGQPGEALRAYERCSGISTENDVGMNAQYEAERLRSEMILGGWFIGSWKVIVALGAFSLSGVLIMPMMPLVGISYLGGSVAALVLYCLARYRRNVGP